MRSRGKHLVRLAIVLLLIGGVTTNCAWIKRMRQTPRQHWWEVWKPKKPTSDFFYPPDTLDPVPPEPPPILGSTDTGGQGTLPDIAPPVDIGPGPTGLDVGIAETPITRKPPRGTVNDLQTVHFAFDSSALSAEARRILDDNARFLLDNPAVKVLIEGHCDERGTQEYNLNLGQRRSDAVREYLVSKGIPPSQLETISFGEERPLDPSSGEAAWAENRRAQFMIY